MMAVWRWECVRRGGRRKGVVKESEKLFIALRVQAELA